MNGAAPLSLLDTLSGYRDHFMDAALWQPHIQRIFGRRWKLQVGDVAPGVAGTFPVFIVQRRWVIKFFGQWFDGFHSWRVEKSVAQWLQQHPVLPIPRLLAQGALGGGAGWRYLIFEYIPGRRIGDCLPQLSTEAKLAFACQLGAQVRALHQIPIPPALKAILPSQAAQYAATKPVSQRNHRAWQSLPERLIEQIPAFLRATASLDSPEEDLCLIHADLTQDHLLGEATQGRWRMHAVIDFGDARRGDLSYELVALHLDLFQAQADLLNAFLDGYGLPAGQRDDLPLRLMRAILLHDFNVLGALPPERLRQKAWRSLEELAFALCGAT